MRSLSIPIVVLFAFLGLYLYPLQQPAFAGLDPPHNGSEFVTCISCHDLASSDPNHLPQLDHTPLPGDIDDTIANNLCWSCHLDINKVREQYLIDATHSSETTSTAYGVWTVGCPVCHNQHTQEQPGKKYIRTTINLADIQFAGTTPPKSGIKSVIYTGTPDLADGDGTYDGICEVCHTKTSHFRNNGTGSDQNHGGRQGTNCTNCHRHGKGFKQGEVCLDCHNISVNDRAAVGEQFTANSHHIQSMTVTSQQCYICHWEGDSSGKFTSYHSSMPGAAVDLVIYGSNARPASYVDGSTALVYTPDGSRSEISSLNTHCLGCHDDDTKGVDVFGDGKSPDIYAWDGNSIAARYNQTETTTWGKYTSATNSSKKNITKAYSAHGNAENNYGGGYATVKSCFGTSITNLTCPDIGGTWNTSNNQCDNVSQAQCTQNYCESLTQTTCENAAGTWGTNSSICKNISQYTCQTGYCLMNTGSYSDVNDYDCYVNKGGNYRQGSSGWICTDITAGQCSGSYTWVPMGGSWHVNNSEYAQGIDYALVPTRGGPSANIVACFDCHNSHGSDATGTSLNPQTTSYASATPGGGILKNTTAGKGGYTVSYIPEEGGTAANRNEHNAGASLCFNCHLTASADPEATARPWSYDATFGATAPILGYFDTKELVPGGAGPQLLYPYKAVAENAGGHLHASRPLHSTPAHNINGLCTPCHDPHGISPTALGTCSNPLYTDRTSCTTNGGYWGQDYGIPMLKGTWVTSPYREDAAPASTSLATGFSGHNVRSDAGYHIDQNTFANWDFGSTAGINEDATLFAGLCLGCHLQGDINPNTDNTWNTMDRIHNTVKGWDWNDGTLSKQTKHNFTCSKCHTPHNGSVLPRLMVTNCLNFQHRGRVGSGGYPQQGNYSGSGDTGNGSGSGGFSGGGTGSGSGDFGPNNFKYGFGGVACHDTVVSGSWPGNQLWNQVTPWTNQVPVLTNPTATGITTASATLGATVTNTAGPVITERGTVWGLAANPTGNREAEGGIATGSFSHARAGLPIGTRIYYRGYAINTAGTGYSPQGSFFTEPETQASAAYTSFTTPSSMTLFWTRGSGDGVIVLLRQGGPVDTPPSDGTYSYNANAVFGGGSEIGSGNYVVYKGTGNSVKITGLYPGTTYYAALYEYAGQVDTAGAAQGTNYKAGPVETSGTTAHAAPELASPIAESIGSETADLGADVVSDGGLTVAERGTVWGTTADPVYPADNAAAAGGTTGIFSHTRSIPTSEVPVNTRIYYRGYARNSAGTGYSPGGSFYREPYTQASGVSFTPVSGTTADITWTRGDGNGVIVLMKMAGPVDSGPVDGNYTGYTANALFGAGTEIGTGNFVVYRGTGSSVTVNGLFVGMTYHVAVYEYSGSVNTSGTNLGTNYRQHDAQTDNGNMGAPPGNYSYTFNYTGAPETVYIPATATSILYTLKGGGGAGGWYDDWGGQTNGADGHVVERTTYTATDTLLTVSVAGGGKTASNISVQGGAGGWGNPSGQPGTDGIDAYGGGGGGGASAIYDGGVKVAAAAGGKGGNSADWDFGTAGSGGPGGGPDSGDTIFTTGGGGGGAASSCYYPCQPSPGGNGQVIVSFTIP